MLWMLVLAGIIASGLFSGAESAFVACPRLRIRRLAKQGLLSAIRMERAQSDPGPYLTTLLVGTNLAIIGGTVVATRLAENMFPGNGEIVATIVLLPLFLVFSEILPKIYFLARARVMCLMIVTPLEFMRHVFRPLVFLVSVPMKILRVPESERTLPVTREELILLAELGKGKSRLSGAVGHLLEKRFASSRPMAYDIMIPRSRVIVLPAEATVEVALPIIRATECSRYPLERDGEWVGLIHILDTVGSPGNTPIEQFSHRLPVVEIEAGLEGILAAMKEAAEHMVAVAQEGKNVGLITLDDIVCHLLTGLDVEEST